MTDPVITDEMLKKMIATLDAAKAPMDDRYVYTAEGCFQVTDKYGRLLNPPRRVE